MSVLPALSFETSDPIRLTAELLHSGCLPDRPPDKLRIAREKVRPTADWRAAIAALTDEAFKASWDESRRRLERGSQGVLRATLEPAGSFTAVPSVLEGLDFDVAVAAPFFGDWFCADKDYDAPRIGSGHYALGWACAFKGAGHRAVTSRRWLEHGPWKLIRGANDLSFVRFHTLDAEPTEALAEARPGHEALADPDSGGLVHPDRDVTHDINGTYEAAGRVLKIPVLGRRVTVAEMMDVRWAERHECIRVPGPLARIAFIFPQEDEAAPHLRQLWLRGFECWVIRDGREERIDDERMPPDHGREPIR